jgi:hypothetical protein
MSRSKHFAPVLALVAGLATLNACGDDDADSNATGSGGDENGGGSGNGGSSGKGGTSGSGGTDGGGGADGTGNGTFTPPDDPGKGGFWVTVSGEDLALLGYDWSADSESGGDPPAFVDGWALRFDHVIVTVDKIRVNEDPDKDEGDPQDLGKLVASADGPFAVDATIGGDVVGKSGSPDEKTVPIAAFATQNDGSDFDPETRYAFSYDLVSASDDAKLVNLDDEGVELYEQAKEKGWSMIFSGTATYRGPEPEADSVFADIPTEVHFTLGLKNPSSYINCRNTDLTAVGEEFPRGIQANADESTIVQITIHTDHAFWDALNVEGTPLHFDPIAANASTYGDPGEPGIVTIEDLVDVDISGFQTKDGETLPWRSLVSDYSAPNGQMKYDPNGTSFTVVNGLASYIAYSAASGGHMNADGECEVKNNFTP